jgi:CheY-like chemotaxis protein
MLNQPPLAPTREHGVLVVDDDPAVRAVVDAGLRQHGFAVWLAADGAEALDVYRNHRETIDVALLDVCMPGLDGPRTLAALQELSPQIRCCFMSGFFGTYSEQDLQELGADAVFEKPFLLSEVADVLRTVACPATQGRPTRSEQ